MSTVSPSVGAPTNRPILSAAVIEDVIGQRVQQVLGSTAPGRRTPERRREKRHPFPYPIHLTPVDHAGRPLVAETLVVIGRHLSEHGLDFTHREPVPYRKVIASFRGPNGWISFLLDLNWCRFTQAGWYENGGRFMKPIESPLADEMTPPPAAPENQGESQLIS